MQRGTTCRRDRAARRRRCVFVRVLLSLRASSLCCNRLVSMLPRLETHSVSPTILINNCTNIAIVISLSQKSVGFVRQADTGAGRRQHLPNAYFIAHHGFGRASVPNQIALPFFRNCTPWSVPQCTKNTVASRDFLYLWSNQYNQQLTCEFDGVDIYIG